MERKITINLHRFLMTPHATLGMLYFGDNPVFSLERPWADNKKNVSCIPEGEYVLKYEHSPKFGRHLWELVDVEGRSEIKIHPANYVSELEGCIALGSKCNIGRYDYKGRVIEDTSIGGSKKAVKRLALELDDYKDEPIGAVKLVIKNICPRGA